MHTELPEKTSSVVKGRELVILSGKGGTGKTSVAGGFSHLAKNAVFCDCDVDAANLALLLEPQSTERHPFYASKKASIDYEKCIDCGLCYESCRFGAISPIDTVDGGGHYKIHELLCEGCGMCSYVCPEKAITMNDALSGQWFVSDTKHGPFVHARLEPAEGNSGRLVSQVRLKGAEIQRKQGKSLIIVDGPPGTGCPVIAAVTGVDLALIVTEPTLSGISDLERIIKVCQHFRVPTLVCINKYDIDLENTEAIKAIARKLDCPVVGKIPYDDMVPKAMVNGHPVTDYRSPAGESIRHLWKTIENHLISQV